MLVTHLAGTCGWYMQSRDTWVHTPFPCKSCKCCRQTHAVSLYDTELASTPLIMYHSGLQGCLHKRMASLTVRQAALRVILFFFLTTVVHACLCKPSLASPRHTMRRAIRIRGYTCAYIYQGCRHSNPQSCDAFPSKEENAPLLSTQTTGCNPYIRQQGGILILILQEGCSLSKIGECKPIVCVLRKAGIHHDS
jgi:hypothetical protein